MEMGGIIVVVEAGVIVEARKTGVGTDGGVVVLGNGVALVVVVEIVEKNLFKTTSKQQRATPCENNPHTTRDPLRLTYAHAPPHNRSSTFVSSLRSLQCSSLALSTF